MRKQIVPIYDGILPSLIKEGNSSFYDKIDGPGGHYAKGDKSDTERHILHGLRYAWNVKLSGLEAACRMVFARG